MLAQLSAFHPWQKFATSWHSFAFGASERRSDGELEEEDAEKGSEDVLSAVAVRETVVVTPAVPDEAASPTNGVVVELVVGGAPVSVSRRALHMANLNRPISVSVSTASRLF